MTLPNAVPQKIQSLAKGLADAEQAIVKATALCQLIADNSDTFSEGEIVAARQYLTQLHRRKAQVGRELAVCIQIYEEKIVEIRLKLSRRMDILESYDKHTSFLSQNKDLMEVFVRGHAQLEREMRVAEEGMGVAAQTKPMEEQ